MANVTPRPLYPRSRDPVPIHKWLVGPKFLHIHVYIYTYYSVYIHTYIYRVSQEEWTKLRESVHCVKIYRYNPKHLCPKLNGYGDKGQRKVWSFWGSTYCSWFA